MPVCSLTPTRLRCEAIVNPLAVDGEAPPRLSWIVESAERNQAQTGYQILAAGSVEDLAQDRGNLWDSGKIVSDETLEIEYAGPALAFAQRCWWKVRVWDAQGRPSEWSVAACFGGGLREDDWQAEWIGFDQARALDLPPAPFDGACWIWLGEGMEASRKGVFVGSLHLPEDVAVAHSQMALAVAGKHRFFWRGEQFNRDDGEPEPWRRPYIRHLNERLHGGENRFFVEAEQIGSEPAAVLFKIVVQTVAGGTFTLASDDGWRATNQIQEEGFTNATTDAEKTSVGAEGAHSLGEQWKPCRVVADYGQEPWGVLRGAENFLPPPACLRKPFTVGSNVRQATLLATALGHYDLYLNGARVNETYFDPGWTDYHRRIYYRAFDVTATLRAGENVLGAVLADGWYSGYIGWGHQRDVYGKHPRFLGQLHIEYADGSTQIVATDASWKASLGPIQEADMLMGETYDARAELTGWSEPGYDAQGWLPVDLGKPVGAKLEPHPAPPVAALEEESFPPLETTEPVPGVFIFNLGQNFAGIARLTLRNTGAGQRIVLRFGERLNADGTLYTFNLRTARATDTYICRGAELEVWSPRFTFHGFQYVEVSGLTSRPEADTIRGVPLSTGTPKAGSFECSDAFANRLAKNIYWSQRSNYLETITDCPQRDERLGWCDGAWTFVGAAALRADVQQFYHKWCVDLDDAQSPDGLFPWLAPLVVTTPEVSGPMWAECSSAWLDAGIICPWSIYALYGGRRQLAAHFPAMVRQLEWYRRTSREDLLPPATYKCLGDWLNYDAPVPHDVFRTGFFAHAADLVARSAEVLGFADEARTYRQLQRDVKAAFRRAYVQPDGRILGDTQGTYALALNFGLLEGNEVARATEHLVAKIRDNGFKPNTGLEMTLPMMLALANTGHNAVAYALLHSEEFPSWNFSIKNGATTIWERWDSWTPERGFGDPNMNSFNHFTLGGVYQWMAENIGGIRQEGVSFKHPLIAPCPGGKVTSARVSYDSVRGLIQTDWKLEDNALVLHVQIPANTVATVILPTGEAASVTEGGKPLAAIPEIEVQTVQARQVFLRAGSGRYLFRVPRPALATLPD